MQKQICSVPIFYFFFKLLYAFCAISSPVHSRLLHKISLFFVITQFVIIYSYCFCAFMGFSFLGFFFCSCIMSFDGVFSIDIRLEFLGTVGPV